jgi:hypothetical protein
MVVLCRACGHVHLALRQLGEPPEPRADEDGPASPAAPLEAPVEVAAPPGDATETVRALGQVVRRPRPTLLRAVR